MTSHLPTLMLLTRPNLDVVFQGATLVVCTSRLQASQQSGAQIGMEQRRNEENAVVKVDRFFFMFLHGHR